MWEDLKENIDTLDKSLTWLENKVTELDDADEAPSEELNEDPIVEDESDESDESEESSLDYDAYLAEIPEELTSDQKSRLWELYGHKLKHTEDEDIIIERESLVLLMRAIQFKAMVNDQYTYESLDDNLKINAVNMYLDSLK